MFSVSHRHDPNPLKKLSSPSEIFSRLRDNWVYVAGSVVLFVVLVALAVYGIRRRKQ